MRSAGLITALPSGVSKTFATVASTSKNPALLIIYFVKRKIHKSALKRNDTNTDRD